MSNLITISDFSGIIDVSSNIKADRFNTYVQEAQRFDLRPLMGRVFFYDFETNVASSKYQDLLNGKSYTNNAGDTIDFKGIKYVMVYFTYGRMLQKDDHFSTPTGFKIKQDQNSEGISEKARARMIQRARTAALSYWEEAEEYLNAHLLTYDKWQCGGKKSGAIRISKIG